MVSPDLTRSTGGWALSNQPHCVVSSVAGSRCNFLPSGVFAMRSLRSAAPTPAYTGVVIVAVGANCGTDGAAGEGSDEFCANAPAPTIRTQHSPMASLD